MTIRDAIQSPPPDQEIPRDSGHSFVRDPSLRPKPRWRSTRIIKTLIAFQLFTLGAAIFAYVFGIRPQVNNLEDLLPIDVLFFCAFSTIAVFLSLFAILLNRSQPSAP